MNNLTRRDGGRIAELYDAPSPDFGHRMGTESSPRYEKAPQNLEKLVEAGGIEPPSEDLQTSATTRLFRALISPRSRPRTGCLAASRLKFRHRAQSAKYGCLAH